MCPLSKNIIISVMCVLLTYNQPSTGARILASVSTPSFSHQVAFRHIWKELAKRGHEVVLITTDPMEENTDNLRQIDASCSYEEWNSEGLNAMIANDTFSNPIEFLKYLMNALIKVNYQQLQLPEVQELIHNNSGKFDLIMTEILFPAHLGFLEKFKAPVIGLVSLDAPNALHQLMGSEAHSVLHPESFTVPTSYPLTFWQRVTSSFVQIFMDIYNKYMVVPRIDKLIKEIFGENSRSVTDLCREVDMLFLNTNPIFHHVRGLTPNTISFGGGSHVETAPERLPEDLKKFLEDAPNGVVYFSLGSNVKSNLLSDNLKQLFLDTFAELSYKVLWKFEGGHLVNKSENIMISKWLPQNDVLKHPNVKVFVSQCGLQSMEEAIMSHVPLVGLPFFGDQAANGNVLHKKGFGISLDYKTMTKNMFKETIIEVITNSKYREKVKEIADFLKDVEMNGLEKVVWWTEYVIRNKGAKIFKNPMIDTPFYQYYLLDVFGFITVIAIVFLLIFKKVITILFNKMFQTKIEIK